MTYEEALEWLTDNIPIDMFDSYQEWYDACRQEIQTPSLWDSPQFNRMHEQYWNDNKLQEEISEPTTEPVIEEKVTITKRTDSNIVIEDKEVRQVPPTDRAPELPKPVFRDTEIPLPKPKFGIIQRIRRFLRI